MAARVSEEDSYRARGYVRFEGEWIAPAEQDAILAQRAAANELQLVSLDADLRVREAEARAVAAESRARYSEAAVPWVAGYQWLLAPGAIRTMAVFVLRARIPHRKARCRRCIPRSRSSRRSRR